MVATVVTSRQEGPALIHGQEEAVISTPQTRIFYSEVREGSPENIHPHRPWAIYLLPSR